ncbi:MAG: 50S ribosomal protein L13 [Chlamydiota bacterium]|jgi:large subunit ribosomal protein L13
MNHNQKTLFLKKEQVRNKKWFLLDASGKTLGRFASEIAKILRGKHKPDFTPNVDCGDGVIVINADKIKVTGAKEAQIVYRHYTGYIGGMRETSYQDMKNKNPDRIIFHAVKGMLPKTKLGDKQIKKLRVFAGTDHKMEAQQPVQVNI